MAVMVGSMRSLLAAIVAVAIATSASAQSRYLLEPGDTIEVLVFQEPSLGRQVIVAPDGRIAFPLVGHLKAGGRSVDAVEATLKRRLMDFYKSDLDVTVLLVARPEEEEDIKPRIYVTGEVAQPGQFEIETRTTVLQAIAMSGGLGPYAAKRRIQIRRQVNGEDLLFPFDYSAVEKGLEAVGNITLRHGDVVIVPERGLFE